MKRFRKLINVYAAFSDLRFVIVIRIDRNRDRDSGVVIVIVIV